MTLVQPGFIHSNSFKNVRYTGLSGTSVGTPDDPYHAHYRFMASFVGAMMNRFGSPPERVARTVLRVMQSRVPPLRTPATLDAHFFSLLRRCLPRDLYHRILYGCLPSITEWGPLSEQERPLSPAFRGTDRVRTRT